MHRSNGTIPSESEATPAQLRRRAARLRAHLEATSDDETRASLTAHAADLDARAEGLERLSDLLGGRPA